VFYKNTNLNYWGVIQRGVPLNALGGGLELYIPKALPVTGTHDTYEFRIPRDEIPILQDSVNLTSAYWEDADSPPDRFVDLFKNSSGEYKASFSMGYLPIAYGLPVTRKTLIDNALFLYTTKKLYPHLIDIGNPITANTSIQAVAFRKLSYVDSTKSAATSVCVIPYNNENYVFIDYHTVVDENVILPQELIGKTFTVIEKSDNVTVGTVVLNKLRVKVTATTPLYGYLVLKVN